MAGRVAHNESIRRAEILIRQLQHIAGAMSSRCGMMKAMEKP